VGLAVTADRTYRLFTFQTQMMQTVITLVTTQGKQG
jgi:hypothetical protein